jgi:nanoRNase/pAp phosphatase (c-di-AMP/oligoRNAs hydrolase)
MVKTSDFKKAIELINNANSWLVTSHTRPDGDAAGCMKVFCEVAKQLGKKAKPLLLSPLARWYETIFESPVPVLGNDLKLEGLKNGSFGKFDLVIIVDTNSYVQLVEFDKWLRISKIPVRPR